MKHQARMRRKSIKRHFNGQLATILENHRQNRHKKKRNTHTHYRLWKIVFLFFICMFNYQKKRISSETNSTATVATAMLSSFNFNSNWNVIHVQSCVFSHLKRSAWATVESIKESDITHTHICVRARSQKSRKKKQIVIVSLSVATSQIELVYMKTKGKRNKKKQIYGASIDRH